MIPLLLALCLAQQPAPADATTSRASRSAPDEPVAEPQAEPTVLALVAARDLYPGVTIEDGDLYAVELPESALPPEAMVDVSEVMGKVPWQRILANEFVLPQRLQPPRPTLPVAVLAGHRVLVIRTPAPTKPLKRVDLWRFAESERCRISPAVKVVARDPLSVAVPPEVLPDVLEADAAGTLRAVSPDSQRGGPCPD